MCFNYQFRSIIVGDSNAGKSSFLRQFVYSKFSSIHELTIGVELDHKMMKINDKNIKLHIWDTAGLERFQAITQNYFSRCSIVFLIFDVCCRKSYDNAFSLWFETIRRQCPEHIQIMVVGTKTDQFYNREVTKEEAQFRTSNMGIPYIEISAKTGYNVNNAFYRIVQKTREELHKIPASQYYEHGITVGEFELLNQTKIGYQPEKCCVIQ